MLGQLADTFSAHADHPGLLAAVLQGEGQRCFAAGGDLVEFDTFREPSQVRDMNRFSTGALDTIRHFPVPVVAALNGDAIGAGAELAVACDMRVFAHHARIGFVQGLMGISTAWGGGADLMHFVGAGSALRLLSRAEFIDATEARALGLAEAVQQNDELFDSAVTQFLEPMRARKPQVMRAFKALAIRARQDDRWRAVRAAEPELLESTWLHPDHWAASDAAIARISSTK